MCRKTANFINVQLRNCISCKRVSDNSIFLPSFICYLVIPVKMSSRFYSFVVWLPAKASLQYNTILLRIKPSMISIFRDTKYSFKYRRKLMTHFILPERNSADLTLAVKYNIINLFTWQMHSNTSLMYLGKLIIDTNRYFYLLFSTRANRNSQI